MLTADQLATLRDEIGDTEPPTDADLNTIWTRKEESLTQTVLSILGKRLATLASGGALSFTVVGEYSENSAANITALERQIARIKSEGIGGEGPVLGKVTVGTFTRTWGR